MAYVIVMLVIGFGYIRELLNNSSSSIVVYGVNWRREMETQDEQRRSVPNQPHHLQEMMPQQRIEMYARGLHDECSNYNVSNISYNAGYKKNMKCSGSSLRSMEQSIGTI